MRVRVHIDRLVLKGFEASDLQALATGIERELARQLSIPGAAERFAERDVGAHFARDAVSVESCGSSGYMGVRAVRGIFSSIR